jgi:protein-S-isoprenylcysteine O-methyltransferase Ste14
MPEASSLIGWLWAAFLFCWLILAQFNKKASASGPRRLAWAFRLVVIAGVLAIMMFRRHGAARLTAAAGHSLRLHPGIPGQWLGVGLCLAGFAWAFWARAHLGRNWGIPMSLRQGHELVTSGPYAYVRHPIYTGIMLAMLGSALAVGAFWLALLAAAFAYFIISARTEERMMLAQFPDVYPAYRRRTKMLIPFVL